MHSPALNSHTHCQATQCPSAIQSLSKSVSEPTHGRKKNKKTGHNNRYKTCPSGHVS